MAAQTLAGQNFPRETDRNQYRTLALRSRQTGGNWRNPLGSMSQVYWRLSFEVVPLLRHPLSPFSSQASQCRLLSSKEKSELEVLMKKR